MGMFDWYEPTGTVACPSCHQSVDSPWQGKDGPNGLFVWRQGRRAPTDQWVDDDIKCDEAELSGFSLPQSFTIYTDCPAGHYVVGECSSIDSVWIEVETRAFDSLAGYVAETKRRR